MTRICGTGSVLPEGRWFSPYQPSAHPANGQQQKNGARRTAFNRRLSSAVNCLVTVVGFMVTGSAPASEIPSIRKNNDAIKHLQDKDASGAETDFLSALGEDPFNAVLHLNLGWTFEAEEKYDMAVKEYESVLRIEPLTDEMRFIANFNAGNALAQKKEPDIDAALRHYQAALDLRPDSKETKTNIEMLFKGGKGKGKGNNSGKDGNDDDNERGKSPGMDDKITNRDDNHKGKFDSKDLTKEDVRKILDEIKSQEEKIRALEYGSKSKDSPPDKDW